MARRYRIGKYYVIRDKYGRFVKWVSISKSIKKDKKSNAKNIVKPGYGYRGDVRVVRKVADVQKTFAIKLKK